MVDDFGNPVFRADLMARNLIAVGGMHLVHESAIDHVVAMLVARNVEMLGMDAFVIAPGITLPLLNIFDVAGFSEAATADAEEIGRWATSYIAEVRNEYVAEWEDQFHCKGIPDNAMLMFDVVV